MASKQFKSSVRIIGGKLRGSLLHFPSLKHVRPTQNHIRETLFNWLGTSIENKTCLDLFAGSGALGFEALSRGAREVTFVDLSSAIIRSLNNNIERLKVTGASTVLGAIPGLNISSLLPSYQIVFLDPPFDMDLWAPTLTWLLDHHLMTSETLLYFEVTKYKRDSLDEFKFEIIREKITKKICYGIARLKAD
jgi:16S rRNA (guanine966-N2)-methyltransferase